MNAAAQTVSSGPQAFSEPRLARALLEQWPGATLVLDGAFDVRWLNRRATQWLRSRAESLVTRPWHELPLPWKIDRPLLEAVLGGIEKRLPPGDLVDVEGQLHSCAARLLPLALESGGTGVLLIIDEVPEARAAVDSDSQRLRRRDLALASAQVGFWEWSLGSGEASIDAEWCRLLEIDPCPGAGHCEAWARNIHPDDQPEFRARIEALSKGEVEQTEVEYRVLTRDYRWVWLMQRGRVVERDEEGRPRRVSGICIDIDERKRNEVDLRASESRLANALWGARAALWQWNVPGRTGTHSPMWYAMTGYTEEEWRAIPDPWIERVHPEDREAVMTAARAHFEGRAPSLEYEYRIRTASGEWHWMLDRGRIAEWDLAGAPTVVIGVSLDVHAQKEGELRLRASETRLETAVWGAGMGLWELDLASGRTSWLNDWCTQFDLEPHEGDALPWSAKIHPADLEGFQRRFTAQLAGQEEGRDIEFRVQTRTGEWKWLLARGRIERAADGTPLRAVGVCMDIHARKSAESAVREVQQRLRFALEGVRAGIWEWSREGGATPASHEVYRSILGLQVGDDIGQDLWYARIHPDDMERVRKGTAGLFAGATDNYQIDYRVQHADGSWIWVLDRGRAMEHDGAGEAVRATGFILDVSANRHAEAALIASEQRFRLATQAVRGVIYEGDPTTGRIERYGLERLLGYQPGELDVTRAAWEDLVHPEDRMGPGMTYEAIFGSGQTAEIRYRLRHRDGHYVHVWDRAVALRDASGRFVKVVGFAMDISAQVHAQEALRRSEALHRSVLTVTPGFGHEFLIDHEGRVTVTAVTEGFEQMFGCSLEEFERRGGWDAFVDRTSVESGVQRERLLYGEAVLGDVRFRTVDGQWKWLNLAAQPVMDPATGQVKGGIGSAIDITRRKLAEEQLRHSQSVLQTVAEASPNWLLLLDRELRCLFINRDVGPATPEQIIGQPLGQIDPEPARSLMRAAVRRVVDTGEAASFTHTVVAGDGTRRYFDCRVRAVRSGEQVTGAVLNISEVTEQRRAGELLRTQAQILETLGEGVVLVGEDDRVRLTNPAFDAMFGYEAGELLGQPIAPLLQLTEAHRVLVGRRRGPHETDATPGELECVRRDGTHFTAGCVFTALELDGAPCWLAVLADITEQKRMEHELVEISHREQRRFGSDLHDGLGQELTGIALLLRGFESRLPADAPALRRDIDEVIQLVNAAIESTRAMAAGLSPVSAARGGLVPALQALADHSATRFATVVRFSSRLRMPLAIGEEAATQLYRIAQEAITNAVRHGHARHIEVELEGDERWLHLCVRDDGCGFDPANASRSGMGLRIMQYRSHMLRGDLVVRAAPERGAEVCCICPHELPADEEHPGLRSPH